MTRRLIQLLALLLALTLVAVACGGDDDTAEGPEETENTEGGETKSTAPTDEGEPAPGGTLRVGLEAETDGLDPTTNRFAVSGYQMGNAVYDNLAVSDPDGQWMPYLAESFTPNEDFTEWDIKVREGIKFHDGEPLNAQAIIANTESALNDPLVSLAVRPIFPEDDKAPKWELIDEYTVRFFMNRPTANFPTFLTSQIGMVASPKWLAATVDKPELKQQPVGTGPFIFESRTADDKTVFVRNDDYWNGEVYLDAIEYYPITDPEVAAGQLIAGDLDAVGNDNTDATLTLTDQDGIYLILDDSTEEDFAMMNTSVPPFDDIRARQAITLATPRQDYIDFVGQGTLRGADSMFPPESPFYNPDVVQEGDDPEAAQPFVDEYCADLPENCTNGKINVELQYSGPSVLQDKIADLLTDGWKPYFEVERQVLLQDEHITEVALGQYEIVTWRQFGSEDPDTDMVWLSCESMTGLIALNWPKYCDEEREEQLVLQRSLSGTDPERVAAWQDVAQLSNEAYTYIFFTHTMWANAFADNVKGVCDATTPEGELMYCTLNGRHNFNTIWIE